MILTGRLVTVTIFVFFISFTITYHITTNVARSQTLQSVTAMQIELQRLTNELDDLMKKKKKESAKWQNAKDDREELSKRLNGMVRDYNLLRCSMINETIDTTADTGAWCQWPLENRHFTDESLALGMAIMFENKTIASFGDGPGVYKRLLLQTGIIPKYDAYDGSPYIENATNNEVRYLDLTIPHYGLPIYDWVISIEVAEHIPEIYENVYLNNLIRHSREGLVLSWAVPHQIGVGHINPKPRDYVIQKLTKYCFDIDIARTNKLKRTATIPWVKMNILVFSRRPECPVDDELA